MNQKLTEKDFIQKYAAHCVKLLGKIETDKMIYGDAFVHFTERGIEVVDPTKVSLKILGNGVKPRK